MKISFYFLSILLLCNFSLFAEEGKKDKKKDDEAYGIVGKLRGKVLFKDKEVKLGDELEDTGTLETKDKSYIQLKIDKWGNYISVGPNTKMHFDFTAKAKYTLDSGACRWKTFKESATKGMIYTKIVSLGVCGSVFLFKATPVFGETEIVMFDGVVHFENIADKSNAFDIKKGQWGGLGGRYGQKINPPLDLPKEVLDSMEKAIE
jgi:hypothetical protein